MMERHNIGFRLGRHLFRDEVFELAEDMVMGQRRPPPRTLRASGAGFDDEFFAIPGPIPSGGTNPDLVLSSTRYYPQGSSGVVDTRDRWRLLDMYNRQGGVVVEPVDETMHSSDSQSEDVDDIDSEEDFVVNINGEELRVGRSRMAVVPRGGARKEDGKSSKAKGDDKKPGTGDSAKGTGGEEAKEEEEVLPPTFRWVEIEIV